MGSIYTVKKNNLATRIVEKWTSKDKQETPDFFIDNATDEMAYEVYRSFMLHAIFELIKIDVESMYNDSVGALQGQPGGVDVNFLFGNKKKSSLVFSCDRIHSNVQQCVFGEEDKFLRSLYAHGSVTTVENCFSGSTQIDFLRRDKTEIKIFYNLNFATQLGAY